MKRYEKYKPSGIEWIGEVPETWECAKLKYYADVVLGKMLMSKPPQGEEDNYSLEKYLKSKNIGWLEVFASEDDVEEMWFSEYEKSLYLLKDNDIVMNEGGDIGKVAIWKNPGYDCYIQNSVNKITAGKKMSPYYLAYLLFAIAKTNYFWSIVSQISIAHLTKEKLMNTPVIIPSLAEQEAIAAYLDARCGDIDKVVATQEKRIALLNEMKQSIITQAVTRGLNPDAKMKDSGVEWSGMVPEHWEVMPFKSKFKTDKGLSITKADLVDEGVPVISYGQIHSKQNDYVHTLDHLLRFIPEELIPADSKAKLEIGDIVFADTSEDVEGSGNAFYIEREGIYAGYHTVIAKSIERVDNKYFAYLFATPIWRSQVRSQVYGVKVYSITQQILKATSLIVPSPEEQKQIVEVLEEKCARIDRQIDNIQNEIELLREYKQSLITDVVTGKVKVC